MQKNIYDSISESWVSLVREIMINGEVNTTEYGTRSKFVNGLAFEINNVKEEWDSRDPIVTKKFLAAYKEQFIRNYKHGFAYTYIDRLVMPVDQLGFIKDELIKGRIETKRLNAITWDTAIDSNYSNKNQPCMQSIWFYPYKTKVLDIHIRFRSWDIFKAYQADILGIAYMLNNEILKPTGYKLNIMRCYGDNCHIYEQDWDEANKI